MKYARERYRVTALMPSGSSPTLLGYLEEVGVSPEFIGVRLDAMPAPGLRARLRRRRSKVATELGLLAALSRREMRGALFHCDLAPWIFFAPLAYLALRSRVVVTLHTSLPLVSAPRRWSWRLKFGALCALPGFHLLAANRDMRDSLRPYLSARALARVPIAYSAIDGSEIAAVMNRPSDKDARWARLQLPAGFSVLVAAQFIDRKGCWTLLEAAQDVCRRHPDVVFIWLGPAPLGADDRRRIESYGLGDRFRYFTAQDFGTTRPDFLNMLRAADLFVLPTFQEGLPLALLEAMAVGTAVISTPVNAIPEAVENGTHGLLTPPGDAAALAAAIVRLKNDDGLRARLAAAGRARVLTDFELATTARATLDVYERAFSK
jgi:glycosyltransferase involved in cell wall biosynthesis